MTGTGTGKIAGGTGAYKGAQGTIKISCTSKDAGAHFSCTYTMHVTKL